MRIALIGDRSPQVRSHALVPRILSGHDLYWVGTDTVADTRLDGFDGLWLLPGSPYRSEEGALRAARQARVGGIPILGTCGGFQHMLLEYGRSVCGLAGAHQENSPDATDFLIVALSCSLVGHERAVTPTPGSAAERVLGGGKTVERYHCAYGLNGAHQAALEAGGVRFTGHDDDGEVRIAELPGHPFWLATLFQPELSGGERMHPVIAAFVEACRARATG